MASVTAMRSWRADLDDAPPHGEAASHRVHRPRGCDATSCPARLQLGLEGVDVGLVDDLGRDDDQLVRRDARLVALEVLGHQLHALIAPFEGLLHDGADDGAFLDAAQRDRVLVEADDRDLAELAGLLQRLVDARRVVGIEADHAVDRRDWRPACPRRCAWRASEVDVVAAHVDQLDPSSPRSAFLKPSMRSLALSAPRKPDEAHALAAVRAAPSRRSRRPACRRRCCDEPI